MNKSLNENIRNACFLSYTNILTKNGKPIDRKEWTVFSAIVRLEINAVEPNITKEHGLEVVAMGTGTKCMGQDLISKDGGMVHDSHAEVIARRAFLCYLYEKIEDFYKKQPSIFDIDAQGQPSLKENIEFHLFSTSVPCGDACIIAKAARNDDDAGYEVVKERYHSLVVVDNDGVNIDKPPLKKFKSDLTNPFIENGISENVNASNIRDLSDRTGAKAVWSTDEHTENHAKIHTETQTEEHTESHTQEYTKIHTDTKLEKHTKGHIDGHIKTHTETNREEGYGRVGILRTKPGRGSRSMSLSCSDKLSRWTAVGVQGALLMHFLSKAIYLKGISISSLLYDKEVMERGINGRLKGVVLGTSGFQVNKALLSHLQEDLFVHSRFKRHQLREHINPEIHIDVHPDIHPEIHEDNHAHIHEKDVVKTVPCTPVVTDAQVQDSLTKSFNPSPAAICWYKSHKKVKQQVIVRGRLLGSTKKTTKLPYICQASLFQRFLSLKILQENTTHQTKYGTCGCESYGDYKAASLHYQTVLSHLKQTSFKNWPSIDRAYYQFK